VLGAPRQKALDEAGTHTRCQPTFGLRPRLKKLEGGVIGHFNSSWAVRVTRDDLLVIQVDGTKGSAVCGSVSAGPRPYARDAAAGLESGCGKPDPLPGLLDRRAR